MAYLEEIDQIFEQQLGVFKSEALSMLKNNLRMIDADVTGELLNSIDVIINKRGGQWEIELSMYNYGRVLEKTKRFRFDKMSPADLAEWVKWKGIQHFDYIPGYENSSKIPDDAHERIAWGIIKYRKGNTNVERRRMGRSIDVHSVFSISTNSPFSWVYKPYFGLWRTHKRTFMDLYFSTTSEELMQEIVDTHTAALKQFSASLGGVLK